MEDVNSLVGMWFSHDWFPEFPSLGADGTTEIGAERGFFEREAAPGVYLVRWMSSSTHKEGERSLVTVDDMLDGGCTWTFFDRLEEVR